MILTGQSYFEQFGTAAESPFKHAWTLGIEEQYYLVFPVLLLVLYRAFTHKRRGILIVIGALTLLSAVLMAVFNDPGGDPSRVYYGTDTRMQDILVGALLAVGLSMLDQQRVAQWAARNRTPLAVASTVLALLTLVWFLRIPASGWVFYGGYLLFDIMFAALVLCLELHPASPVGRALQWRPIVWIGMLSYGLYLWHWPLFILLTPEHIHVSGIPLQIIRFAATFAIASASYYLIENPIRRGVLRKFGRRVASVVPVAAVAATVVALVVSVNGMRLAPVAKAGQNVVVSGQGSGSYPVLIVGDSVGFNLGYSFPHELYPKIKPTATVDFGCGTAEQHLVINGKVQPKSTDCDNIFQHWSDGVSDTHPKAVIWTMGPWDVYDHEINGRTLKVGSSAYSSYLLSRLNEGLRVMKDAGNTAPVVIPTVPCLAQPKFVSNGVNMATERNQPSRAAAVNKILQTFAAQHSGQVHLVDSSALLCPNGKYQAKIDGVQMRQDGVHFTNQGVRKWWEWMMPQLKKWVPGLPVTTSSASAG